MKTLIITVLTLAGLSAYAGHDGNGGILKEMLEAERKDKVKLTQADLDKIVAKNGLNMKKEYLWPLFRWIMRDPNLTAELKSMAQVFNQNRKDLQDDVMYAKITLGNCSGERDTCTSDNLFTDVTIDRDVLSKSGGVTFSELAGLLVHEFAHHFIGQADHPNYRLALYARDIVLTKENIDNEFNFSALLGPGQGIYHQDAFFVGSATIFCQMQGFQNIVGIHSKVITEEFLDANRTAYLHGKLYSVYVIEVDPDGSYRRIITWLAKTTKSNVLTKIVCK